MATDHQNQDLSLEQMVHLHKYKVQRATKSKRYNTTLFHRDYHLFTYLQEPKNRYEINIEMSLSYDKVETLLLKYEKLGLIQVVEYNPNKYKITSKGLLVLYKIKELNNFITMWETNIELPLVKPRKKKNVSC